jgi:hypothetical protein
MKLKPPDDQLPRVGLAGLALLLVLSTGALGVAAFVLG